MTLEQIKTIEDEYQLENILMNIINEQTGLTLEHLKAQPNRQVEIKKKIANLKEIERYLVKKLNYHITAH